jgi:hypothetical protein
VDILDSRPIVAVDPPRLPRKAPNNPDQWIHQVVFDYGWSAALYVDLCWGNNGRTIP